ncbi:MAG: hypothetical protein ACRDHW_20350 [Ktedonobacteraceae bacterium]
MQTAEKCAVIDEFTTLAVIEKHHASIRDTIILLHHCLDALIEAWIEENADALDKAVDHALEAASGCVEDALERLEELTAHASELEAVIAQLKALHLDDLDIDESTP